MEEIDYVYFSPSGNSMLCAYGLLIPLLIGMDDYFIY